MNKKFMAAMVSFLFFFSVPWLCYGTELTILHTNDTHSHLYSFGPGDSLGGIARMSYLIKKLKRQKENVLTLNSGDVFVGTFAFNTYLGYAELKIMEDLYDAMCLGNHEFDLGPEVLGNILNGRDYYGTPVDSPVTLPMLCANADLSGYPELDDLVEPSMVIEVDDIKVGLIGVVTTDEYNYSKEVNDILETIEESLAAVGAQAYILKTFKECDVVICLSHLGIIQDEMGLSQIPNIDIIVGGHSHTALFEPEIITRGDGTQVIIVQAGEYGKYLGELNVNVNVENGGVELLDYELHSIDKKVRRDPWLIPKLALLRSGIYQKFGPVYAKRVARAKWNLEERWEEDNPHRDTALGNLIADAIRIGVEREIENGEIFLPRELPLFVIEPNGYIGHRIYKGKVVGNDILRSVPYGYEPSSGLGYRIQLVPLAGAQILGGLELTVSQVEYTDDLSLQVSGLEFEYDSDQPSLPIEEIIAGNLSRLDPFSVRIQGQPIDFNAPYYGLYWVAMNERVVELLGSFGLEPYNGIVIPTGLFEYELVHDYMRELKKLTYTSEGRIIDTAK